MRCTYNLSRKAEKTAKVAALATVTPTALPDSELSVEEPTHDVWC